MICIEDRHRRGRQLGHCRIDTTIQWKRIFRGSTSPLIASSPHSRQSP
jgi:hypothetical protein